MTRTDQLYRVEKVSPTVLRKMSETPAARYVDKGYRVHMFVPGDVETIYSALYIYWAPPWDPDNRTYAMGWALVKGDYWLLNEEEAILALFGTQDDPTRPVSTHPEPVNGLHRVFRDINGSIAHVHPHDIEIVKERYYLDERHVIRTNLIHWSVREEGTNDLVGWVIRRYFFSAMVWTWYGLTTPEPPEIDVRNIHNGFEMSRNGALLRLHLQNHELTHTPVNPYDPYAPTVVSKVSGPTGGNEVVEI